MFIQKALGKEQDMYLRAFVCEHECVLLWGDVYTWSHVLDSYVCICIYMQWLSGCASSCTCVCSYIKDLPGEVGGILCKPCVQV